MRCQSAACRLRRWTSLATDRLVEQLNLRFIMLAAVPLVAVEMRRRCWRPSQPLSSATCVSATKLRRHTPTHVLRRRQAVFCLRLLFVITSPCETYRRLPRLQEIALFTRPHVFPSEVLFICGPACLRQPVVHRSIHMRPITLRSMQHPFHPYLLPHL